MFFSVLFLNFIFKVFFLKKENYNSFFKILTFPLTMVFYIGPFVLDKYPKMLLL